MTYYRTVFADSAELRGSIEALFLKRKKKDRPWGSSPLLASEWKFSFFSSIVEGQENLTLVFLISFPNSLPRHPSHQMYSFCLPILSILVWWYMYYFLWTELFLTIYVPSFNTVLNVTYSLTWSPKFPIPSSGLPQRICYSWLLREGLGPVKQLGGPSQETWTSWPC